MSPVIGLSLLHDESFHTGMENPNPPELKKQERFCGNQEIICLQ